VKKRITRILAGLAVAALATSGVVLAGQAVTVTPQDTGWGAPDTTATVTATDAGAVTVTTLGDTGWG